MTHWQLQLNTSGANKLNHWDWVTHICLGKLTINSSDNRILLFGPLGTNFNENLIGIQTFPFTKMPSKMLFVKWWSVCLLLNVFKWAHFKFAHIIITWWFHGISMAQHWVGTIPIGMIYLINLIKGYCCFLNHKKINVNNHPLSFHSKFCWKLQSFKFGMLLHWRFVVSGSVFDF